MAVTMKEVIERFRSNAEYERTHGNLEGCLEFRQIADWLEDSIFISKDATNGDVQKAILPKHWQYGTNGEYVHVWGDNQTMTFTLDWWNTPFRGLTT
jgi:hypothetical protein